MVEHGSKADVSALVTRNGEVVDVNPVLFRMVEHRLLQHRIRQPVGNYPPSLLLVLLVRMKDHFRFAPTLEILADRQCMGPAERTWDLHSGDKEASVLIEAKIRLVARCNRRDLHPRPMDTVRRSSEQDRQLWRHREAQCLVSPARVRVAPVIDSPQDLGCTPVAHRNVDEVVLARSQVLRLPQNRLIPVKAVPALVIARQACYAVQLFRRNADSPQLPHPRLRVPYRRTTNLRVAAESRLAPDDRAPLLRLMEHATESLHARDIVVVKEELSFSRWKLPALCAGHRSIPCEMETFSKREEWSDRGAHRMGRPSPL